MRHHWSHCSGENLRNRIVDEDRVVCCDCSLEWLNRIMPSRDTSQLGEIKKLYPYGIVSRMIQ
jgi:hypothetical protein